MEYLARPRRLSKRLLINLGTRLAPAARLTAKPISKSFLNSSNAQRTQKSEDIVQIIAIHYLTELPTVVGLTVKLFPKLTFEN